jgi:hypothetical protein
MTEVERISTESPENPIPNKVSSEAALLPAESSKFFIAGLILLILVIAAGVMLQNQSLKSQLGLGGFKFPWTQVTCDYNGQSYRPGEGFMDADGCNSCSCTETGEVACTAMACDSDDATQADPAASWKTYSNNQYNLSFKYPSAYVIEENPDNTENRMQIIVKNTSVDESFTITIWKKFPPGQASYFMDTESTGQKILAGYEWDTFYLPCGYRDGMNNSPCISTYALQTETNGILYTATFGNQNATTENQDQILSSFEFIDQVSSSTKLVFSGTLSSMERPAPDINYDFQLELDSPYFDELNAQGPRNVTSIVVVPENEAIRQTLAANVGNAVSIKGIIEWGLAETRHLKASKIIVED